MNSWEKLPQGVSIDITFREAAAFYVAAGGDARYLTPRLLELIGHKALSQIDQSVIDEVARALFPQSTTSTPTRQVYTPVSAVLKFSARHGWCDSFRVRRPRAPKQVMRLPSQSELDAFARAAGPSLKQIMRFKLETDATEHEMLTLDWSEMNISRKQAQLRRADGRIRIIVLSRELVEMLARASKNQIGRVFRSDNGRPYKVHGNYGGRLKTAFDGASKRSGVKITFLILHRIWCARQSDAARDIGSIPDG